MNISIGIDIGSRNTKLVAFDSSTQKIAYSDVCDTGVHPLKTVEHLLQETIDTLHIRHKDIIKTYTTGYGRKLYPSDKAVSEISCHARGVQFFCPQAGAIIDIGGQDSKIISLDEKGHILDFVMNDKCAAGTGRFLEMVALRLGVGCDELSNLASGSNQSLHLNNTCVVFAESEIVGLIAEGKSPSDIARAIHLSIAERITAQLNQLKWQPPLVFTGGVALNKDLGNILSQLNGVEIIIPAHPEITGALGAAIIASNEVE